MSETLDELFASSWISRSSAREWGKQLRVLIDSSQVDSLTIIGKFGFILFLDQIED